MLLILQVLFYSCSSQSENLKKSNRGGKQTTSSIERVRKALDQGQNEVYVKEPAKWDLTDENYIYGEKCQVKTTDLNSDEIIRELKAQVLTDLAEGLEITIKSVFFSQIKEDNEGI